MQKAPAFYFRGLIAYIKGCKRFYFTNDLISAL